jgi:hypothetical protein
MSTLPCRPRRPSILPRQQLKTGRIAKSVAKQRRGVNAHSLARTVAIRGIDDHAEHCFGIRWNTGANCKLR